MKFFVIFLAVFAKSKLPVAEQGIKSVFFQRWLQSFQPRSWFQTMPAIGQFVLIVVLPALVFSGIWYWLESFAWGLFSLAIEFALLLYILRHADVKRHLECYQSYVQQEDLDAAYACAQQHLCRPDAALEQNWQALQTAVTKSLLYRWFEYFFMVIFWYMLAGLAGMVVVWFTLQYARQPQENSCALRIMHWFEVIPVRLLALTYGLAGNFTQALPVWREYLFSWRCNNEEFLHAVASKAVDHQEEDETPLHAWEKLHHYCVSIWMVMIAVASLGGWLG